MRDWTDEELGDLLSETFRSREGLADPETARTLTAFAVMPRRGHTAVVAAAAVVVLVAGGMAYLAHRGSQDDAEPVTSSTSSTASSGTAANLATASRLSASLLHALPMPPGSTKLDRSPAEALDGPWFKSAHRGLAHQSWWTVPMTSAEFEGWLRSHPPRGLTLGASGTSGVAGALVEDREFDGPGTAAYTGRALDVSYLPHGDRLAVRISTYVNARYARTVLVPASTRSVAIRLVTTTTDARQRRTTTTATVTEPTEVGRLVGRFNALPGTGVDRFAHSCPAVLLAKDYTLEFRGPDGDYTVTGSDECDRQLDLRRNDTPTAPAIDADDSFFRAADAELARGSGERDHP